MMDITVGRPPPISSRRNELLFSSYRTALVKLHRFQQPVMSRTMRRIVLFRLRLRGVGAEQEEREAHRRRQR